MRIAYLECFSGISGDMFLGALVDAGVSFDTLAETAAALNVGARLEMRKVTRGGIAATKVDVLSAETASPADTHPDEHDHNHQHAHEHTHEHAHHDHKGEHTHEHSHS